MPGKQAVTWVNYFKSYMHKFLTVTYNLFCALFKSCIDHTYVRMFINLLLMRRPCLLFEFLFRNCCFPLTFYFLCVEHNVLRLTLFCLSMTKKLERNRQSNHYKIFLKRSKHQTAGELDCWRMYFTQPDSSVHVYSSKY